MHVRREMPFFFDPSSGKPAVVHDVRISVGIKISLGPPLREMTDQNGNIRQRVHHFVHAVIDENVIIAAHSAHGMKRIFVFF